jgi:hypothetical protein
MADREQVKNQMASFKQIEGLTHQTSTLNYFTFDYDIRKCAKKAITSLSAPSTSSASAANPTPNHQIPAGLHLIRQLNQPAIGHRTT